MGAGRSPAKPPAPGFGSPVSVEPGKWQFAHTVIPAAAWTLRSPYAVDFGFPLLGDVSP